MAKTNDMERNAQENKVENQQYLTFVLDTEMFAVGIQQVREIIEYESVTTVPMMPAFVRGVINLRGSVVPVIDLSVRFGRQESGINKRTCIVVMEVANDGIQQELGVIVDSVSEVIDIALSDIEPPPAFGSKIRSDFISGMGKIRESFVVLLEMAKVLSIEEMVMLAETSESSEKSNL